MKHLFGFLFSSLLIFSGCTASMIDNPAASSPNKALEIEFMLDEEGRLLYQVTRNGTAVIAPSPISFVVKDQPNWEKGLVIGDFSEGNAAGEWETVWGEDRLIQENYGSVYTTVYEAQAPHRAINIEARVFDDGVGFRYTFEKSWGESIIIMDERTQFTLTGDHTAWWIPADFDSYEFFYNETKVSEIDVDNAQLFDLNSSTLGDKHAVNTPVTMKTGEGLYLSFHEANLTNYSGMTLRVEDDKRTLTSSLVPAADGSKATVSLPFTTPWRTIQIAESPAGLMESHLIMNLNEDNVLEDVSWIQPGKYMGIWWGHHLGKTTWAPGETGGATTEEAMRYIDFASEHGFPSLLIEGWNIGWDKWGSWPLPPKTFSFTKDAPNFNLQEVVAYGNEKGVGLIAHHETASDVTEYEEQMEDAFDLMQELGIRAVKTGYVGPIVPTGEHHHGQWMVNHYRRVLKLAAEHEVMVVAHEPIKPTGLRRTYPNMVAREGVRGSEFNSPWGGGNPPEHLTIVPFTRGLAGPIDYTPGIVAMDLSEYPRGKRVPSTVGYQLAEYIVIYSPMQMASDLPENYEGEVALDFIKAVPTDWEQSKVLNAEIGKYVTVA
ncbi:MAG TPA: alpha-glucosidase, partial [Cytophagales bacterium]|nr:alpha-glucosidase [Cytophagales bacterium]